VKKSHQDEVADLRSANEELWKENMSLNKSSEKLAEANRRLSKEKSVESLIISRQLSEKQFLSEEVVILSKRLTHKRRYVFPVGTWNREFKAVQSQTELHAKLIQTQCEQIAVLTRHNETLTQKLTDADVLYLLRNAVVKFTSENDLLRH